MKNTYTEPKEVRAAQGVKITAKDLEKAIAGLNLLVAYHPDEIDIWYFLLLLFFLFSFFIFLDCSLIAKKKFLKNSNQP